MRKRIGALIALCLCLLTFTALAQENSGKSPSTILPGKEAAQTLSMLTGVAISPLFGVGAIGAWQYFHAQTEEQKARLHWYANPWFWVPALLLVTACFIKDTAGTALPTVLKKPLDIAEAIEHKISGIVATGAFVPLAIQVFEQQPGDGASLAALGFAVIDPSPFYHFLVTVFSMFVFFVVFVASNAINVLVILSPFTTLDTALKGFRAAILGSVVVTAWMNPWIGAAWAIVVIVAAYFIAGWSFRLSHFGAAFIWDFVTSRCNRFVPDKTSNKLFLSRKIQKVPARTYGRLTRDAAGHLILNYRPWLVLPSRTLTLPDGPYVIGHGLLYSEILRVNREETQTTILLPPRYRGHENELVTIYGLSGVRETGIRAMWKWLRGTLGGRPMMMQA